MRHIFNVECRKVGGLRFLFVGRLTFMFCVSRRRGWDNGAMEARGYVTIDG